MIGTECFNKLNLVLVNNTGAKGCPDRTFTGTSYHICVATWHFGQ
jgi:hypothetical protein